MKQVRILLLLSCLVATHLSTAQVTSVSLHDLYDAESNTYTMQLIVNAGSATTPIHRVQFNAQVTIVSPAENPIKIIESIEPLQGNVEPFSGTVPANWKIGTMVEAPEVTPDLSYYSASPTLSPTSRFNELEAGMCIDLFTYRAEGCTDDCARLYINGSDPTADMPGMSGADLTIGYTIGTLDAIFDSVNDSPSCLTSATTEHKSDLQLYPNPATDYLTIPDTYESGTVNIRDMLGSLVLQEDLRSGLSNTIDISRLSPGSYLVSVTSGADIYQQIVTKL